MQSLEPIKSMSRPGIDRKINFLRGIESLTNCLDKNPGSRDMFDHSHHLRENVVEQEGHCRQDLNQTRERPGTLYLFYRRTVEHP